LRAASLYDSKLEATLRQIIGGALPRDVFRELQLPVKSASPSFGVGLLSAVSSASAAYLSSRLATSTLVNRLLSRSVPNHLLDDVHFEAAYKAYTNQCEACSVPHLLELVTSRAETQKELVARVHKQVLLNMDKGDTRTRLFREQLAVPGSKDWLKCAPAPGMHTHIADRDFRHWFRFWCRIPLFNPGDLCPRSGCRHILDQYGDHLLGCTHGISKGNAPIRWRHDALTRLLYTDLLKAKRRPLLERRDPDTGKSRPDIKCLGTAGGVDFIEVSVTHPLPGHANVVKRLQDYPEQVLHNLVRHKIKQHGQIVERVPDSELIIFAFTTLGGWTKAARKYVKGVVRNYASQSMDNLDFAMSTAFAKYAARMVSCNVHCLTEGISTSAADLVD